MAKFVCAFRNLSIGNGAIVVKFSGGIYSTNNRDEIRYLQKQSKNKLLRIHEITSAADKAENHPPEPAEQHEEVPLAKSKKG